MFVIVSDKATAEMLFTEGSRGKISVCALNDPRERLMQMFETRELPPAFSSLIVVLVVATRLESL